MSEILLNDTTWTIGATAVAAGDTTITVVAYAGNTGSLGSIGAANSAGTISVRIRIDNELMQVTGTSGNTFTVVRGLEGTTAAAHVAGSSVYAVWTRSAILGHNADMVLEGTTPNLPAAGTAGRLYLPDSGNVLYRDNGTTWASWGPIFQVNTPPGSGSWTQVNITGNTAHVTPAFTSGYPELSSTTGGTNNEAIGMLAMSAPATPYACEGMILYSTPPGTGNRHGGLIFYDSVSGKAVSLSITLTSGYAQIAIWAFSSPTSFNTGLTGPSTIDSACCRYLRMTNDGSYLRFYCSGDGTNWALILASAVGSFVTPNMVGFYIDPAATSIPLTCRLIHWKLG